MRVSVALVHFTILFFLFFSSSTFATPVSEQQIASVNKQISNLQQRNRVTRGKLKTINEKINDYSKAEAVKPVSKKVIEFSQLSFMLAKTELLRVEQALRDANRRYSYIQKMVQRLDNLYLERSLEAVHNVQAEEEILRLQEDLAQQQMFLSLQRNLIDELNVARDLAKQWLNNQEKLLVLQQELYYQQQRDEREEHFQALLFEQQQAQSSLLQELNYYRQQRQRLNQNPIDNSRQLAQLDAKIFYLEEKNKMVVFELWVNNLTEAVNNFLQFTENQFPYGVARVHALEAAELIERILNIKTTLEENLQLMTNYQQVLRKSYDLDIISRALFDESEENLLSLQYQYRDLLDEVRQLESHISEYLAKVPPVITQVVTSRQVLPGLDWDGWTILTKKIFHLPEIMLNYLQALRDHTLVIMQNVSALQITVVVFSTLSWLLLWYLGRHYSGVVIRAVKDRRQRVTGNLLFILATLIRRNIAGIVIFGIFFSAMLLLGISFKVYAVLFYVSVVWFIFRFIINIARLSLVDRISDATGNDVRLYHRLKWTFILGGIITALTVIVRQLHVDAQVQDLFVRLMMIFLLTVSWVLLRGHSVVPSLIEPFVDKRRVYLTRAIHLLCILIPLMIMSVAIIGLLGYIDLARAISYYQVVFIMVVVGYIIVRGLFVDLIDTLSHYAIRRLNNGWLWSEAFLKPIDNILRLATLFAALFTLFTLYGWGIDSVVVEKIVNALNYTMISFAGGSITLLSTIQFVILVFIFIWAAKWIKEFAYRWLFKNVRDAGIRYSLSIFSQYLLVAVGTIITLRVWGIDFTGMAFVVGGLLVGLGFALRDFANNIISGIMILIERPIKEGDLVSVGEFDGEVKHIGLRSTKVQSFDHMEVMVPNSEVFNKIFTNWTHDDDIIRTSFSVKIQRVDSPFRAQQIIAQALANVPEILEDPEPEILLKNVDEVLIEFHVRYFMNVIKHNRFKVKSGALFSIWARFAEHGIKPPYPVQRVVMEGEQLIHGDV